MIQTNETNEDYEFVSENTIMKKGKHAGQTFGEIFENNKQYCKWVVEKANGLTDDFHSFQEWLKQTKCNDGLKLETNETNEIETMLSDLKDTKSRFVYDLGKFYQERGFLSPKQKRWLVQRWEREMK